VAKFSHPAAFGLAGDYSTSLKSLLGAPGFALPLENVDKKKASKSFEV
jgi:hypothetical protein